MSEPNEHLSHIRHSLAHLLAASVRELYPGAKNAIGPAIDDGFYQDFELPEAISDKDRGKIEQKMRQKIKHWTAFERKEVTTEEAKKEFAWNEYKTELILEFSEEGKKLTFYTIGDFIDLCKGGHVDNPAHEIPKDAWKLDRIAGAYWRGDEKNKMLTRIYGLAFETKEELVAYEKMRVEAEKRDHKKLGRELDLFTFSDLVGGGLPLWTPKGTLLRNILDGFVWELREKAGYEKVEIPHITKKDLYEKSGHWQKFKDELFRITTREKHEFAMKPMNCPHHTQIYARKTWSYRELPQRYATTTMVYRDEQSGELSGLSRVRAITQDDAHVFCRPDQVKFEMAKIWNIIETFYGAVGFTLTPRLSLHDTKQMEKYLGTEEMWQTSESELRELVKERGATAAEAVGEAAFYGPKVDFMGKDSIGREWQVATIQLDMNMPARFELQYTNEKGDKENVVMIHAAIMGSIERYLSIIIEHFAGAFPLWLSPVQVKILPVGEKFLEYAKTVHNALIKAEIRSELDESNETLGKKVRGAKVEKVPYLIVVGEKEMTDKTVTLEGRAGSKDICTTEQAISRLHTEIKNRK
ncbi:MAG: threonine--tRNA ligase [Candidatus Taylorbacteria bacterium CG11_big_fil_rev_8_21_14_0_20_46_11]|uniref:Threonine--tRNA ligase n=1 Tax=Candidatus Taylorbacteria bacterium CG11_big_fil_rev_8_21_14_0_20_46_11 TaxID=1975025 RepID=A0A2H0KAU2_9BACT|nr:MAG: threonine--tRNA ligase [Candidatus Taylorbacteria bacterium CG11_big_fil_rev_8_21_14_0_20_46_11]